MALPCTQLISNCTAMYAVSFCSTPNRVGSENLISALCYTFDLSERLYHCKECKAKKKQCPICDIVVRSYTVGLLPEAYFLLKRLFSLETCMEVLFSRMII